jgi:uncharacterized protein
MDGVSRAFQVFVKPTGALCNLNCEYCYYLNKTLLYPENESFLMPDIILEEYIVQHIEASTEPVIQFSWHGGEPLLMGLKYFQKIVAIQQKHLPGNRTILNGIQTNGTLLDVEWCQFLAAENFYVGLSLDGPRKLHDRYRRTKSGNPTFSQVRRGYDLLRDRGAETEILCVVNDTNVRYPQDTYRFFKQLGAEYLTFLPLVETDPESESGVSQRSVSPGGWGDFLCVIFDEWMGQDIGRIKIQIFEEAVRTAFSQEHSLCIFRETCGDIPVLEHNGDVYSCDHFVDIDHRLGNIIETPLAELLESPAQRAFGRAKLDLLPGYCRQCEVLDMCNGGCPKNRFSKAPDREDGLNYLCSGYKKFFIHCKPFIEEVAAQWRRENSKSQIRNPK